MNYRSLGRTGVMVSPLCFGTMIFGSKTPESEAINLVDSALDAGINYFDTANVYGRGTSEEILGKALARDGKREKVILATKVWGRMRENDPNARGIHRRQIIEQCNASLKRLNTDWIDLYYIHRPMADIPIDETLRALDDLVQQGKIHYIACSTYSSWGVMEALWTSERFKLNRFIAEQPPYHLFERAIERELLPMAMSYDLAIMPWSPLAGGLLTGKYTRDDIPADGRLQAGNDWDDKHFKPEVFDALDALQEIATEKGCTLAQLSLAWLLAQPGVTAPVIGARNQAQFDELIGTLDVEITEDDRQRIDAIFPPYNSIVPYYYTDGSADFRPHQYRP